MKKYKLLFMLKKYQKELKSGNQDHLKDYIGLNVVLPLTFKPEVFSSDVLSKTSLNSLICTSNCLGVELNEYKVPTLNYIYNFQKEQNKFAEKYSEIPLEMLKRYAALTWMELMIYYGIIYEYEIIDLTKYKLIDFISDERLRKILGISNIPDCDLTEKVIKAYDNKIQSKGIVKLKKKSKKNYE